MRLPSPRFLIGLVLVLVAAVVVAVVWLRGDDSPAADGAGTTTVTCIGGSEKTELMADPEVARLLRDKYQLAVTFEPLGSYDQVQLPKEELDRRGADCLWPSSESARGVFESTHSGQFPQYRAENVLQSPEVLYAGPQGTEALLRAGLVERRDNRYYLINMKSLLLDYVVKGRTWDSLGSGLRGPVGVASTDPAKSNSGFVLAQLELSIIATSDVFSAPSVAQARQALPTMRRIYEAQGLQARSSEQGFQQWLLRGGELSAPLYAGYENQLLQQVAQDTGNAAQLARNVRILYPDPTVYSDHPILALSARAARLIEAMKDPEIQTLAWRRYGFRSGVQVGLSNVADFADLPLADQIRATAPPNAEVTLLLLNCMKDANRCS